MLRQQAHCTHMQRVCRGGSSGRTVAEQSCRPHICQGLDHGLNHTCNDAAPTQALTKSVAWRLSEVQMDVAGDVERHTSRHLQCPIGSKQQVVCSRRAWVLALGSRVLRKAAAALNNADECVLVLHHLCADSNTSNRHAGCRAVLQI